MPMEGIVNKFLHTKGVPHDICLRTIAYGNVKMNTCFFTFNVDIQLKHFTSE